MSSSTEEVSGQQRLVDQAYRQIRDAIVAVRLQPGAPLDEKALSASLGLGLTPVRDALKRLTLERLPCSSPDHAQDQGDHRLPPDGCPGPSEPHAGRIRGRRVPAP